MPNARRHLYLAGEEPTELREGRGALRRGAWAEAAAAFERLLATDPVEGVAAEAWAGLGLATYWLDEPERSARAHERALALYEQVGRPAEAARMALWLADVQQTFFGALAVASGLVERAERLLGEAPPGPGHAWLPVYRGHSALMVDRDPDRALDLAREALRLSRDLEVPEAEVVARALEGLALVTRGEVGAGMARLDEASATAIGRGLPDLNAVAWACCYLIAACESVRDLARAADWCRRVLSFCARWGLKPVFISCRTRYASILTWQGRWDAAESELREALTEASRASPPLERAGAARLGELRRRQGDDAGAEAAFQRAGEHDLALLGQAALALDRGEPEVATDLAGRLLRRAPARDRTARADALLLLARAASATGDVERAASAADELIEAADRIRTEALAAAAAFARGVLARARRETEEALSAFEEAVARYDAGGAPFEAAEARLELSRTLNGLGRDSTARREAGLAREAFRRLGARRQLERTEELLDRLTAAGDGAPTGLPLTPRELEVLGLVARGLTNDEIADELDISPHTVKRHVSNILLKLGESSRAAAVARATRAGAL